MNVFSHLYAEMAFGERGNDTLTGLRVLARGGERVSYELLPGDVILRRGDAGHVFSWVIQDGLLRSPSEWAALDVSCESSAPGGYARVSESGARQVTDRYGRLLRSQVLCRATSTVSDGEALDPSSLLMGMTLAQLAAPRSAPAPRIRREEEADYGEAQPNKWRVLFPKAQRTRADFQHDGAEYFTAIKRAIETADRVGHYIYILGWMFDMHFELQPGNPASSLYQLLSLAALRGVEIRILIWDTVDENYAKLLREDLPRLNKLPHTVAFADGHNVTPPGAQQLIAQIAPTMRQVLGRIPASYIDAAKAAARSMGKDPNFYLALALKIAVAQNAPVGAHHEKVVIVKGSEGLIAFCGGMDFNSNRLRHRVCKGEQERIVSVPSVHDLACRLQGPAAHDVLHRFIRRWRQHPRAKASALTGEKELRPAERPAPYPYVHVVGTYNPPDGSVPDRTLRDAYLAVIKAASRYIYIEDQYLVNLDVARELNAKLKESTFERLFLVIQDASATSDILIPNRKRVEFLDAVRAGLTDAQKKKVSLAIFNAEKKKGADKKRDKECSEGTNEEGRHYHLGMHAKTLIVDDELAIIGSANLNQRSFTCDSETSAIIYDDVKGTQNFAKVLRMVTWREYLKKPVPRTDYEDWNVVAAALRNGSAADWFKLVKYEEADEEDLDDVIISAIRASGAIAPGVMGRITGGNLQQTSVLLNPLTIKHVFDTLWTNVIDPVVPYP